MNLGWETDALCIHRGKQRRAGRRREALGDGGARLWRPASTPKLPMSSHCFLTRLPSGLFSPQPAPSSSDRRFFFRIFPWLIAEIRFGWSGGKAGGCGSSSVDLVAIISSSSVFFRELASCVAIWTLLQWRRNFCCRGFFRVPEFVSFWWSVGEWEEVGVVVLLEVVLEVVVAGGCWGLDPVRQLWCSIELSWNFGRQLRMALWM